MHIAIIKGVGGRTLLKQRLSQLGASVTNFDCYERLPNLAVIEQLGQNEAKAECVVATSGELIELALMHLDDAWRLKTWVVVSERTAEIAREKGIEDVVVSPSARNEDLYTTCQK
jgi:uroporphyrinogen-III synthase